MFTGIVETRGVVAEVRAAGGDKRFLLEAEPDFAAGVRAGDSVAVNGACLTALAHPPPHLAFDVSLETLARTTLGQTPVGTTVNLERALTPQTRLGGHLVSGHVDGIGEVVLMEPAGRSTRLRCAVPAALRRYLAVKGSVCIEGVSLTINALDGEALEVNLVPHTLEVTTLGALAPGAPVNLEVDMIARYLEQLVLHGDEVAARLSAGGAGLRRA